MPVKFTQSTTSDAGGNATITILADGKEWMVLVPSEHQQEIADIALESLNHAFNMNEKYQRIMAATPRRVG